MSLNTNINDVKHKALTRVTQDFITTLLPTQTTQKEIKSGLTDEKWQGTRAVSVNVNDDELKCDSFVFSKNHLYNNNKVFFKPQLLNAYNSLGLGKMFVYYKIEKSQSTTYLNVYVKRWSNDTDAPTHASKSSKPK